MKRKHIYLILILSLIFVSCTAYNQKEFSKAFTYKDPQTIGGFWTITFDNGDVYEHAHCLYWGIEDDTSTWQLPNGKMLIQSGNIHAIQE